MKRNQFYAYALAFGLAGFALNACGGGSAASVGSGSTGTIGGLSFAIVGAAQAPVTSSAAFGANVTGIAGALIDRLTLNLQGPSTLEETRIVFTSNRTVGTYEIYTMKSDGSDVIRLTNNVSDDGTPRYSPDGTKIAFQTNRDGNYEIYTMNVDGTGVTRITNNTSIDALPTWSPDSQRLAFSSNRDGNYEIYRMNADGTGQTRMTNNAATEYDPAWSPDGLQIAFYSNRDGNTEIYKMNTSGSGLTRLTNNTFNDIQPHWNAQSSRIVFGSDRDGNYETYTMNDDGSGVTRLTNNPATDFHAEFSVDGSRIIFYTTRALFDKIFTMNTSGGDLTLLSDRNSTYSDIEPSWSPFYPRTPKTLIGPSGTLGTAAAGFLFGQKGDEIKSIVSFDTTTVGTRAASRIVSQSAPFNDNGSNLIFSITTSAGMASLSYAAITEGGSPGTPVSPSIPAGTTAALVSFNAGTGLVSSVFPYAANRSAESKPVRSGDNMTYRAEFTAVYDEAGKNLAPAGASEVVTNTKTGTLVSFVKN